MQDAKEEVRSRLNIEDVIGEYVHLKRAGRNFKGLSLLVQTKIFGMISAQTRVEMSLHL
jgi:DNA primase